MKPFWKMAFAVLLCFLLLFALVSASGVPLEQMALSGLRASGPVLGALASIAPLTVDVFLPVPSSVIMVANGALYGPWLGAALSLLGGLGATAVGYGIGRAGEKAALRWVSAEDLAGAQAFFARWGAMAVVVSRPVPLLAETVAVMAGLSGFGLGRSLLGALLGLAPVTLAYALSGAYAVDGNWSLVIFLVFLALSAMLWRRRSVQSA